MPYADVNGMSLWYEEHGESGESGGSGEPGAAGSAEPPLVLLHGGFGAGEMFQPFLAAGGGEGRRVITVDLQAREVRAEGVTASFELDENSRWRLLNGLDDISITLQNEADIAAYETKRPSFKPRTLTA